MSGATTEPPRLLPPEVAPPTTDPYSLASIARDPGLFLKGIAPGAIGNFLAPSPDVAAKTSSLPGIVTGNVSGIGNLLDMANKPFDAAANYVRGKLGIAPAPSVPKPQFIDDWSKAYEGSVDRATGLLPTWLQADPQNAAEEAVTRGGNAVGSMLGAPIPSRVITALPRVLQVPASFVAPLATGGGIASKTVPIGIGAVAPLAVEEGAKLLQTGPQTQTSRQSEQPNQSTAAVSSTTPKLLPPEIAPTLKDTAPKLLPDDALPTSTTTQGEIEGGESSLTGGGVAGGLLALIAAGLAAKYHTRIPGLANALERPGYARDAAEFNAARQRINSGDPTQTFQMSDQPAAPLGIAPEKEALRRFQASVQDRNSVAAEHINGVNQTDKDLAPALGIVNNSSSQNARVGNMFETGVHDATGISLPSWGKLSRDIGRLSPEDQQILHTGLWSSSALDNRYDLYYQAKRAKDINALSNERNFRTGLYNISDADLRANVAAMENTPHINDLAGKYRATMLGNLDIADAMGFPKSEIADIRRINPNYVPTVDSEGNIAHTFSRRDVEPYVGNEIPNTTPWDAGSQHNAELYKLFENNALKRRIIDADMHASIMDPKRAPLFSRKADYTGADVRAPNDTASWDIYRSSGKETYLVHNKDFADLFDRNPTMTHASIGALRRFYQRGVTGPLAMIGGKVFPFVNAARTGYYLPINAPTGFAGSYLDKAFQRATGRNLRVTLDQYPGMIGAGAMDAGNLAMHGLANGLERGAKNYGNQVLRHIAGDANVDSWRQAMLDKYKASITNEMRSRGVTSGLGYGHTEVPAYQAGVKGAITRNPAADMAPGLYRANNPFTQATMPYGVGMKKLVNEAFDVVNNMGHSHFYRLNRNNPNISPERLVYETRRLTGDMGVRGKGRYANITNEAVPFVNAATQDIAQLSRTIAERPVATPLSHIANMTLLGAGSLYSAMHVPGALHHLHDLMSTTQRATGPVYYTDPNDPTKYQQLSLPQNVRGLWPIVQDLMGHATGAWDARHDEPSFQRAYHTLSDVLSHHVSNYAATSALHGLGQAVDPYTSIGQIGNTLLNAAGKQWDARPEDIIRDLAHGRMPSLARNIEPRSRVPNQAGTGEPLDTNSIPMHILSSVMGIAGGIGETANRGISAYNRDGAGAAWHAVIDNLGQHFRDQNPMFNNTIWSNQGRISSSTPLTEANQNRLRVINEIAPTATSDIRNEGFTRKGGVELSGLGEKKISSDPTVQQMYFEVKRYGDNINNRLMKEIHDIEKQRNDLANTRDTEAERRRKSNEFTQQINDKHYLVAQRIAELNKRLSQLAGKPIDVGSREIDWSKDASQFR